MTTPHDFFNYFDVSPKVANVTLDLMQDIWADLGLTATPVGIEEYYLLLSVSDGHGGYYIVSNGSGNLPDGDGLALVHHFLPEASDTGWTSTLYSVTDLDGDVIKQGEASQDLIDAMSARQKMLAPDYAWSEDARAN